MAGTFHPTAFLDTAFDVGLDYPVGAADRTLTRTNVRGTSAQRASYTPWPPPIATEHDTGYLFFETDTHQLYAWDGTTWCLIGP